MKILLALFALFISAESFAQESEQTLETVFVEDTYIKAPLNYPSAFSTILKPDDFVGEFNTISELLSLSPGVVIRDFGGYGQLKTLSIRGSSNDQVVILMDGVRLNSPIGGGVDLSTIPIDFIDTLEIVRGGASALAGSDAIGGVVNIVTKKTDKEFTSVSATYGSFQTFKANISRADNIGNLGYFISFTHAQSEGDFDFKTINGFEQERINNEYRSESFFGKLVYELNDWELIFLNDFYYDDKGVPGLGEFQEPNSNQTDIRNLTALKIIKDEFLIPTLNFETIIFNRFDRLDFENPDPTLGIPIDTLSDSYSFGITSRLEWLAPREQIITFATELRAEILKDDDFNNPERINWSLFLGDEISFLYNFITLQPVIRFDLFKTYADNNETDAELSPKLGFIFSPLRFVTLKSNIGRSFRVPNFGELFFPEQGFIGGNPDLVPETSIDFDIGLVLSHPRFSFEINYFRNNIDDLILFVFVSAQRIEPRNVGDVKQQGIETSLLLRPTDFIELYTAYTYLDGKLDDTGAQLPGRPKNKLDFRGVITSPYASIYWESHYVDEIPLTAFPDSRATESRTTHDIGAVAIWKGFSLSFEIKNLFDNKEVRDAFDFPLPGRSYFITAYYKYDSKEEI